MKSLLPGLWTGGRALVDPFTEMRRDLDAMFNRVGRSWPSFDIGAAPPAVNVAETDESIEVTAELPGVDEKDITLDIDGNRLMICGEKKAEMEKEGKNWHVMERSYGSFQRSVALPFEPKAEACDARFDKGVLYLKITKPQISRQPQKKIEIKSGAPSEQAKPAQAQVQAQSASKAA